MAKLPQPEKYVLAGQRQEALEFVNAILHSVPIEGTRRLGCSNRRPPRRTRYYVCVCERASRDDNPCNRQTDRQPVISLEAHLTRIHCGPPCLMPLFHTGIRILSNRVDKIKSYYWFSVIKMRQNEHIKCS
jgi:hypothetical protein